MYPKGFRIYRTSRGIKRPTVCQMTEGEAQKLVGDTPLTYEKTIKLTDKAGDIKNIINYRTYTKGAKLPYQPTQDAE